MSKDNDLPGLPKAIYDTLAAHPDWDKVDGRVFCIGPGCDWKRPRNGSIEHVFRNHQKYWLLHAIGHWYNEEEDK